MAFAMERRDRHASVVAYVSRLVVTLVVILSMAVVFWMVRQSNAEGKRFATLERYGVDYVGALVSMELAVSDLQEAALTGTSASSEEVTEAVDTVAAMDERYGDDLRTHERWEELRAKIETLPTGGDDVDSTYASFAETTDLLLALVEKVRTNAELIRDPDADSFFLQDAMAQELPEAIVAASRLADLSIVTTGRDPDDQSATLADLLSLESSVTSNATDLSADVRETIDTTESRTLGGNLLSPLDRFRQAIDTLVPSTVAMDDQVLVANIDEVRANRSEAMSAAQTVASAMLTEMDQLLVTRLDSLNRQWMLAIGAVAVTSLAVVVQPIVVLATSSRRRATRRQGGRGAEGPRPGPSVGPAGHPVSPHAPGTPPGSMQPPGAGMPYHPGPGVPTGSQAPAQAMSHDQLAALTSWEQSGATR